MPASCNYNDRPAKIPSAGSSSPACFHSTFTFPHRRQVPEAASGAAGLRWLEPRRVLHRPDDGLSSLAAGSFASAAITGSGELYLWGTVLSEDASTALLKQSGGCYTGTLFAGPLPRRLVHSTATAVTRGCCVTSALACCRCCPAHAHPSSAPFVPCNRARQAGPPGPQHHRRPSFSQLSHASSLIPFPPPLPCCRGRGPGPLGP